MKEHASDCALHNAPARMPGPCSCGVSPSFKMWGYDVQTDEFGFAPYSRETLIADLAASALLSLYQARSRRGFPNSLLIERAIAYGLCALEMTVILECWRRNTVDDHVQREQLRRLGVPDRFVSQDLSPLDPEVRAAIIAEPTTEEIVAALGPWCDYHLARWPVVTTPERPITNG